jgi:hypothetical protein
MNQNNLQIRYQDSKFQSTPPSSFDFIFWVQKTWIVHMMNEKNGSIVKVYWLIDPPLIIWNEMFFQKKATPTL